MCALANELAQFAHHQRLVLYPAGCPQGVDFFFGSRSAAQKFCSFLESVVPTRKRSDKQLVSMNEHEGTYNYKYTFSVEIVPLCKVRYIASHLKRSRFRKS